MQAEHSELIEILNVIICGALTLHVIAAAYTNNYEKFTYLCKPTDQQLNTICNRLILALNNNTSEIERLYNRPQTLHRHTKVGYVKQNME